MRKCLWFPFSPVDLGVNWKTKIVFMASHTMKNSDKDPITMGVLSWKIWSSTLQSINQAFPCKVLPQIIILLIHLILVDYTQENQIPYVYNPFWSCMRKVNLNHKYWYNSCGRHWLFPRTFSKLFICMYYLRMYWPLKNFPWYLLQARWIQIGCSKLTQEMGSIDFLLILAIAYICHNRRT